MRKLYCQTSIEIADQALQLELGSLRSIIKKIQENLANVSGEVRDEFAFVLLFFFWVYFTSWSLVSNFTHCEFMHRRDVNIVMIIR